ncbi:MAG: hypothetical protein QOI11_2584 [Candidatus Eremiobacteraeota bacterium]|jgi:quinol monooxygenase YgiN|nr:hypothetical protein [Candidatus Eremiobacteraeota bacterium]
MSTGNPPPVGTPGLVVFARFEANEGWEGHVRTALMEMVAPTLLEEANLGYAVHESSANPRLFLLYEQWTGKPGLEEHMRTPHFRELTTRLENALAKPLEVLEARMLDGEVAPAATGD